MRTMCILNQLSSVKSEPHLFIQHTLASLSLLDMRVFGCQESVASTQLNHVCSELITDFSAESVVWAGFPQINRLEVHCPQTESVALNKTYRQIVHHFCKADYN